MKSDENAQDSCFFALTHSEVDLTRHFPVKTMFDSVSYRKSTADLTEQQIKKIDKVQEKFKEFLIPTQTLETDERSKVAIVFERINRAGTDLDTYQLLTAWSWSEDFDLQEQFEELFKEIEPFGFSDLIEDKDLQLKCCSGIILGEATPSIIMQLRGEDVRSNFEKIKNGIKSSIDFLKKELFVPSLSAMPYPAMLVPLSSFFATHKVSGKPYNDHQRKQIIKWFWKSNFSRRYSSSIDTKHKHDLSEFNKLQTIPDYEVQIPNLKVDDSFFTESQFSVKYVNTKTYILLLAQSKPKSFISGAHVDLEKVLKKANRNEFHHIFPSKFLERQGVNKTDINQFANLCFLSSSDNQVIKDKAPSDYKKLIASSEYKKIMEHALCPEDALDLNFDKFIEKRLEILKAKANELIK